MSNVALRRPAGPPEPRHSPSRRVPMRGRVAVLALLATVLGTLGVSAAYGPAQAIDDLGLKRPTTWTVADDKATGTLPGEVAGLGPMTVTRTAASTGLSITPNSSGPTGSPFLRLTDATVSAMSGCLNTATVGVPRNCGATGRVTLTFPRPMVNPSVYLAMGSGANLASGGQPTWCSVSWLGGRVTAVNGQAPTADAVSLLKSTGSRYRWDPATFAYSQPGETPDSPQCVPPAGDGVWIGVAGVVTSIEIETSLWAKIAFRTNGTPVVSSPSIMLVRPEFPVADLRVSMSAPVVVDAGAAITWSVDVRNVGASNSHGFVVRDVVPAGVSNAVLDSAPPGCTLAGRDVSCVVVPPGCAAMPNATVVTLVDVSCTPARSADAVMLGAGQALSTITVSGTAPTVRGTVVEGRATVAGVDLDDDVTNNVASVTTTVAAPTLAVGKDVAERIDPADQFRVEAASGGSPVVSVATEGTASSALSTPVQVARGQAYTITESTADGSPTPLSRYGGVLTCSDGVDAPVTVEGPGPSWTFTPTENRDYTCVVTNTALDRGFAVEKSASLDVAHPGDTVRYSLLVTNTGDAPYTAADPASLTDDLSDVLDDAAYAGDATDGVEFDGSVLSWSGPLGVGESITLEYSVTVGAARTGDGMLRNAVVTAPGSGGTCPAGAASPLCSTETPVEVVTAPVLVEKVSDGGDRLAGAGFEVLSDDAGAPGTPVFAGEESETGLFTFDLAPGTYWLRETAAPDGHALLAEPVSFTVSTSGLVALSDPGASPQVAVTGEDTLTVTDVRAVGLPFAGGAGGTTLSLAGGAVLVLAAAVWALRSRRGRSVVTGA